MKQVNIENLKTSFDQNNNEIIDEKVETGQSVPKKVDKNDDKNEDKNDDKTDDTKVPIVQTLKKDQNDNITKNKESHSNKSVHGRNSRNKSQTLSYQKNRPKQTKVPKKPKNLLPKSPIAQGKTVQNIMNRMYQHGKSPDHKSSLLKTPVNLKPRDRLKGVSEENQENKENGEFDETDMFPDCEELPSSEITEMSEVGAENDEFVDDAIETPKFSPQKPKFSFIKSPTPLMPTPTGSYPLKTTSESGSQQASGQNLTIPSPILSRKSYRKPSHAAPSTQTRRHLVISVNKRDKNSNKSPPPPAVIKICSKTGRGLPRFNPKPQWRYLEIYKIWKKTFLYPELYDKLNGLEKNGGKSENNDLFFESGEVGDWIIDECRVEKNKIIESSSKNMRIFQQPKFSEKDGFEEGSMTVPGMNSVPGKIHISDSIHHAFTGLAENKQGIQGVSAKLSRKLLKMTENDRKWQKNDRKWQKLLKQRPELFVLAQNYLKSRFLAKK